MGAKGGTEKKEGAVQKQSGEGRTWHGGTSESTESGDKDGEAGPICQLIHNKLMSNRDL